MTTFIPRAAFVGTFGLLLAAAISLAAAPELGPEWHQDIEYLTWDRALDEPLAAGDRQVFLHPTDEKLGEAWGADVAPVWHERVKSLYVSLLERGKHTLGFGRDAGPVEEPVGIASRSSGAMMVFGQDGTIVR